MSTGAPSKFVCRNCGVSCGLWAKGTGTYWKHQTGGYPSPMTCGKPAEPILRSVYEAAHRRALAAARV